MDTRGKAEDSSAAGLGPYKATKLWNDVITAFRQGVPVGKHRRYMRTAENCFVGSSAVDWLQDHLKRQKDFGSNITRQQTTQLLNKFYKAGIFEEIQISRRGRNKNDFSDSNRLYRLLPVSPSKSTRTPLAPRSTNTIPFPSTTKSVGEEKTAKREQPKARDSLFKDSKEHRQKDRRRTNLDIDSLPQCHLVGRFLTGSEIHEIWKTAALSRLKKILGVASLEDTLHGYKVDGGHVRHNCIFLNKSGIVTNIPLEDQLPHWVLSAMKCLARWPEKVEDDLPNYPGFERDVFGVVKDYFISLPEPLVTYELYDIIINVFVQACNQLSHHSSPFSSHASGGDGTLGLGRSLWSDNSLENVILNLTRKYCMADSSSNTDLFSLTSSRPDLFQSASTKYSQHPGSHRDLNSLFSSHLAGSYSHLTSSHGHLASSQGNLTTGGPKESNNSSRTAACRGKGAQLRAARSQGDLQRGARRQGGAFPAERSKSQADLIGGNVADSHSDLFSTGRSLGNVHAGLSSTNLHGTTTTCSSRLGFSSLSRSGRSGKLLSDSSSRRYGSSPDLQVTRYETAFGPENQTVTRVIYQNGVAQEFHHSTSEETQAAPLETHFDVEASISCSQPAHVGSDHLNESIGSRYGTDHPRSYQQFLQQEQQQLQSSRASSSSVMQPASRPVVRRGTSFTEAAPSSPTRTRDRKPPLYRRCRAERSKTLAGSQLTSNLDAGSGEKCGGLDEWDRELSVSTPYLPGLKVSGNTTGAPKPRQLVSRSTSGGGATRAVRRCSSTYMSFPQSSLHEERATKALQMLCLFLPPASRRKLHFLLKLISKMAANPFLTFDPSQSTRSLVLGTFQHAVLRSRDETETELDAVLVFQLVSFLVDHHMDIMAPPMDMKEAVEDRLRALEKPQISYSPRDPRTLRFSRTISMEQYDVTGVNHSHQALIELLDNIIRDQNMADREKRRRLKQFQKTYPQIYRRRFPAAGSDPLEAELRPRIKAPLLSKSLLKLKGLRV